MEQSTRHAQRGSLALLAPVNPLTALREAPMLSIQFGYMNACPLTANSSDFCKDHEINHNRFDNAPSTTAEKVDTIRSRIITHRPQRGDQIKANAVPMQALTVFEGVFSYLADNLTPCLPLNPVGRSRWRNPRKTTPQSQSTTVVRSKPTVVRCPGAHLDHERDQGKRLLRPEEIKRSTIRG